MRNVVYEIRWCSKLKKSIIDIIIGKFSHSTHGYSDCYGHYNGLKDLADPPHFSPEIGATETLKKSPETAETMASVQHAANGKTGQLLII